MALEKRKATVGGSEPAEIWTYKDMDSLAKGLAEYICNAAKESLADHGGSFSLAISGGSLVKALSQVGSVGQSLGANWSTWHIFWADERVVPLDHPDSNYGAALAPFLSQVPVPKEQVHAIEDFKSAREAAALYEAKMKALVAEGKLQTSSSGGTDYPKLDLILLGVGPDGHVASLFPGHPLLEETQSWVAPIFDSPKPPPQRITLTLPVINAAARVGVVTTGSSKGSILQKVFGEKQDAGSLPAQMVVGQGRDLVWFLDEDAAKSMAL